MALEPNSSLRSFVISALTFRRRRRSGRRFCGEGGGELGQNFSLRSLQIRCCAVGASPSLVRDPPRAVLSRGGWEVGLVYTSRSRSSRSSGAGLHGPPCHNAVEDALCFAALFQLNAVGGDSGSTVASYYLWNRGLCARCAPERVEYPCRVDQRRLDNEDGVQHRPLGCYCLANRGPPSPHPLVASVHGGAPSL